MGTIKDINGQPFPPQKGTIAAFYKEYLQLMKMNETLMPEIQKQEVSRAFYGACGKILVFLLEEVQNMEEEAAIAKLNELNEEVARFFIKQTGQEN